VATAQIVGALADRYKGSVVSLVNFVAMLAATVVVLITSKSHSLPAFVVAFTALFALTGVGNGSVYKMIPAIFHGEATGGMGANAGVAASNFQARRLSSAVVGVGAIGACGGVLVQIAFRQSFLSFHNGDSALRGAGGGWPDRFDAGSLGCGEQSVVVGDEGGELDADGQCAGEVDCVQGAQHRLAGVCGLLDQRATQRD
jgi:hypothetical protein